MSADITIFQKGLFKKRLPLSVILGNRLQYGAYDSGWRMETGKMDETEFTAFLPDAVARGFSVTWNPQEKDHVSLRLLTPTSHEEIREFYAAVERIVRFWNAELRVEGKKFGLDQWLRKMEEFIDFNDRALKTICQQIVDGKKERLQLFAAFWPLTIGREEALRFADHPTLYASWLQGLQNCDVYYAVPKFYNTDEGVVGRYVFTENCLSTFPTRPSVPFGMIDPDTDKQLTCDSYQVAFFSSTKKEVIGSMDFHAFFQRLPSGKVNRYDAARILIEPLTLEELQEMLGA